MGEPTKEQKMVLIITKQGNEITTEFFGEDLRHLYKTEVVRELHEQMVTSNNRFA